MCNVTCEEQVNVLNLDEFKSKIPGTSIVYADRVASRVIVQVICCTMWGKTANNAKPDA